MDAVNDQLVLIVGESTTGKSASLRNLGTVTDANGTVDLSGQKRWMFLNCESGKRLPFRNKFSSFTIVDPYQVYEAFDHINNNKDYDGVIIDTLTFLMDMFESKYIVGSANTMQGWANYNQYFKNLMQDKVASSDKAVIFLAHTREDLDEKKMEMKSSVPIKGALKGNGVEAYFSTVVAAKRVPIKELEAYGSDLLTITDHERELGYKHVFQTQITKTTTGERIRSPMGMFTKSQTYMDNDAALLLKHLHEYYN